MKVGKSYTYSWGLFKILLDSPFLIFKVLQIPAFIIEKIAANPYIYGMNSEITEALKDYTRAFYGPDWNIILSYLYEKDINHFHKVCLQLAELIEPFGEQQEFLRFFKGVKKWEELKNLSPRDFFVQYLSGAVRKLPKEKVVELIETMDIQNIVEQNGEAVVFYTVPMELEGEIFQLEREAPMIKVDGEWKIRIRGGLETILERFQKDINLYHIRKERDIIDETIDDDDLHPFPLYGYRNLETGRTVIEPRFKKAGEFSEGLAPVKVFSKFGYINKRGEFQIKPEFDEATTFSEGLAAVSQTNDELEEVYGFIDSTGKLVIPYQYENTSPFSEGLAAVKLDGKWGYIDHTGKEIIGFFFNEASDFEDGEAEVEVENEGLYEDLIINKKGKVLGRSQAFDDEEDA